MVDVILKYNVCDHVNYYKILGIIWSTLHLIVIMGFAVDTIIRPQQVNKSFLLHLTFHAIKFNSKTITDIENIHEYYMKPLWQSIQRKNPYQIRTSSKQMNKKCSTYKKQKRFFVASLGLCLKTCRATVCLINPSLYYLHGFIC